MTRKGIYVNGKEIVARYLGDKLLWERPLIQTAHFENFYDWIIDGEANIVRNVITSNTSGAQQQPDYDYEAVKAKINGKYYDLKGARMIAINMGSYLVHRFVIIFKNQSDRNEVSHIYRPDIYLYKRG